MLLNSKYDNQYINTQLHRMYNIQKDKFIVMSNIC